MGEGPVLSDAQFHEQAMSGGATRHFRTLRSVVDEGYAVGGAGVREKKIRADKFTQKDVGEHLSYLHKTFGNDPTIHQGAWRENDDVVLDASNVFKNKAKARMTGIMRGERAIYDIKGGKDINLPRRAVK
jgi:hypothetical protein